MIQFDLPWMFVIPYLFLFGAIVGSFLNVCVYRLPQHDAFWDQIRGLWSPPSHCPRCGKRIWRQDNLPVIGWVRLRGRCRFCRTRISPRYPLIEAVNGLLFVLVFFCEVPTGFNRTIAESCVYSSLGPQGDLQSTFFSPTMVVLWRWLYHMVLIESLLVATLVDFDLRIIPDGVTLPAMAVGVLGGFLLGRVYLVPVWFQDVGMTDTLASLVDGGLGSLFTGPPIPEWISQHPHWHGLAVSLAGIMVGGGSIWMVRIIGHWVLKREAMGFGDVVLMATIGSFLGWQPTLIVFFVAPVCALAVVIVGWVFRRDREIPYGPYLSLAALVVLLDWKRLWPPAEQVFSLGLVVPLLGIVMCVMLFFSLQLTQWSKRLLGLSDFLPEDDELEWQSADQLFHYARDNADHPPPLWQQSRWPGLGAGRGSLHEQRWRNGH